MKQSTRVLYIIVTLCLGLVASTTVLADATTTRLFYTKFSGSPNVKSVVLTYDGVATMTLATPVVIGTTTGADGITGNPQNSDLLIVGGQGGRMNTISISTSTATIYPSPVSVFHLEIADPTTIYGSGIPGALTRHTINPDGSLTAGTVITISGPDTKITQLITTPVGFFYTSSGAGGSGSFGTLAVTGATTVTTTRLLSAVPAAHGGVYDPFTGTIILMGNGHLTQFNLAGAQIADLDFAALGLSFGNFDQGTVDGAGHLFVAQNSGHLTFVDYAAAAGGLIDDPGNFIDVQFLDTFLDDIAPLVGPGGTPRCDPDPRTQGYWHRQCLGVPRGEGGIDPGRNGRGPSEPIEPEFQNVLMPAVDVELQNRLFLFGGTCQDGIDADPPSDPCEKAIKQFTAMLLNLESDRLQTDCSVDPDLTGCDSDNIDDLLTEIANLILAGSCNEAAACAAAVNEGEAGVESGALASTAVPATTAVSRPASAGAAMPGAVEVAEPTVETVSTPASSVPMVLSGGVDVPESQTDQEAAGEKAPAAAADEDPLEAIQRHLTIVANASSLQEDLQASTDALLTVLSGGYELEVRIQVVRRLLRRADVRYESLLAEHLRDIRDHAMDLKNEAVAKEAKQLLRRLAE